MYNKLQQAGAERMESERDARFRETLASLKKTFPGELSFRRRRLKQEERKERGMLTMLSDEQASRAE